MGDKPRNLAPTSDQRSAAGSFADDVMAGLSSSPKVLDCKYFYDAEGERLFKAILKTPEYYVARAETEILKRYGDRIRSTFPAGAVVIEYGSGSSRKTRWLLSALREPAGYAPIDFSIGQLRRAARRIAAAYPSVLVAPIAADFARPVVLPAPLAGLSAPRLGFFPGTSFGNLDPDAGLGLLRAARALVGPGGQMILGLDLKKSRDVLEAAYDDAQGLTARFNLNLLRRINQDDALRGDFDLGAFRHEAVYDEALSRIEMRLVSLKAQAARVGGRTFRFAKGERILTEISCKYDDAMIADIAARTGFTVEARWGDSRGLVTMVTLRAV